MSLILALGSNLGDKRKNLIKAHEEINKHFEVLAKSKIYQSEPVEYLEQNDFFNQVIECQLPSVSPLETWKVLKGIEEKLGRNKIIPKGPRNIDIDIIFWQTQKFEFPELTIPHKSWQERSFVVKPLKELPYFSEIQKVFSIPENFASSATPIS